MSTLPKEHSAELGVFRGFHKVTIALIMKDFEEYIRQGEPEKAEKSYVWQTAIGLQDVDGLKPSPYLLQAAKQNIEGSITIG